MPYDFSKDTRPKIPLSSIVVEDRGREDFSHVDDLRRSIEEIGLINPITVEKLPDGKYKLLAGETRYRACLMLAREMSGMIPYCDFKTESPVLQKVIELEENVRRKNLEWVEVSKLMKQIDTLRREIHGDRTETNPDGWDLKKTAQLMGVDASTVSRNINLAKKLEERPDILEKVKHLPINPAMRVIAQIEESEKAQRLVDAGHVVLTSELQNLDALVYLAALPDNSIDLILTDPPFGLSTLEDQRGDSFTTSTNKSQSYKGIISETDNLRPDDALALLARTVPHLARVLKPGSHFYIFFDSQHQIFLANLLANAGLKIHYPILIWDKDQATTVFRGYNYQSCYESIIFGWKGDEPRRLNKGMRAILKYPPLHASKKIHPFQKPEELLGDLIKNSTNIGDIVLDPFCGSGSTLIAAKQTGRQARGCEVNQANFLAAQSRLLLETK